VTDTNQERLTTEQLANMQAAEPPQPDPRERRQQQEQQRAAESEPRPQLLAPGDRETMTTRWREIQADFVDHPRQAMQDADALVAGLMQQLAQTFAQERQQLEGQWSRGDDVSTEDLRVSLQRYRAFFERLLSA
jgi:carotenoid cleavage dioxygenase-like enzyme